jgi:hypothetical protein
VGKSTILRLLSDCLGDSCVYLDKDTINQALLGDVSGGTLNTWRSGDDGRPVTERLQVRF